MSVKLEHNALGSPTASPPPPINFFRPYIESVFVAYLRDFSLPDIWVSIDNRSFPLLQTRPSCSYEISKLIECIYDFLHLAIQRRDQCCLLRRFVSKLVSPYFLLIFVVVLLDSQHHDVKAT